MLASWAIYPGSSPGFAKEGKYLSKGQISLIGKTSFCGSEDKSSSILFGPFFSSFLCFLLTKKKIAIVFFYGPRQKKYKK